MKPELEILSLGSQYKSINYFEIDLPKLEPFWHYHPELELTLITKGNGTRFVGNSIESYHDGDLVLVGENLPHHWVSAEGSHTQGATVLQFSVNVFASFRECDSFKALYQEAKRGIHFPNPTIKFMNAINELRFASGPVRIGILLYLLEQLNEDKNRRILCDTAYARPHAFEQEQSRISNTINYILENINENLTVNQMAEYTNLVPQSFCRWFRKSTGLPFVTFLNSSRIENACQELISTETPMSQIALRNGFETVSHFNRTFKTVKGESPSEYKKRLIKF